MRLKRDFFRQNVYDLAQTLLGKVLCINREGKLEKYRIVETEAYGGVTDKAAHSYNDRKTKRTAVMYDDGGHLYIYLIYGMYYMLNVVANVIGIPEAVLIRAIEPLDKKAKNIRTNGPGKLCRHLGFDMSYYGVDLTTSHDIYLIDDEYMVDKVTQTTRINVDYAEEDKDLLWRFYLTNNPYVSKK